MCDEDASLEIKTKLEDHPIKVEEEKINKRWPSKT